MMAYENPTLLATNHYRFERLYRGWGGTNIQAHNSGDLWWRHGGGIFRQAYNEDKIGTTIFYKVSPVTFAGFEWPVSSIDAKQYTIQGTYFRPQNAPSPHIWVDSVDYTQTTLRGLTNLTSKDLKAEWQDAARLSGYGSKGYGQFTYGNFITDTTSHDWRVEVVGSGDTVVRSTVVTTPFFSYLAADNLSDNGAFRPNVSFKLTPYNEIGDAPRTEVVSLEFFAK
jgi:hypothetical protein